MRAKVHRADPFKDPDLCYTDTFKCDTDEEKAAMGASLPTEFQFILELEHSATEASAFVMQEVKSTNLSHIGYDPIMEELAVAFGRKPPPKGPGGLSLYVYLKVKPKVFLSLVQAQSIGKKFQQIKKELVDFDKVAG